MAIEDDIIEISTLAEQLAWWMQEVALPSIASQVGREHAPPLSQELRDKFEAIGRHARQLQQLLTVHPEAAHKLSLCNPSGVCIGGVNWYDSYADAMAQIGNFFHTQAQKYPHHDDVERLPLETDFHCRKESERAISKLGTSFPLNASQQAIVDLIGETGHRLTKVGILDALNAKGLTASPGTTGQTLAALTQFGVLTNLRDHHGRGYGLPEWTEES